jgi:succinyl-diaminopimelate desuccinylase
MSVPNTAANVIPAFAEATFNIRYNDIWRRPTIEEWVRLQCDAAALATDATYDVSFAGTGDVFLTEEGPLVQTLRGAVHKVTGRIPKLSTSGGTSDARFIKDYCPVVEFGLVNRTIHQVDERVPLQDLEELTQIYERFIADFARAGRAKGSG